MYTDADIKQIAARVLAKYEDQYDYIGIRVQDEAHNAMVGQTYAYQSHAWIDGVQTDEHLNGVSAVSAAEASRFGTHFGGYSGDAIIILGAYHASGGEDDGEIIMRDPMVLEITA